jgi:hypothetical protein
MKLGPISCTPRLQASVIVVEFAHLVNLASSDNLVLNTWKIYIGPACSFIWTTYYHMYVTNQFICYATCNIEIGIEDAWENVHAHSGRRENSSRRLESFHVRHRPRTQLPDQFRVETGGSEGQGVRVCTVRDRVQTCGR